MSTRLIDWQTSRDGRITVVMTYDDGAGDNGPGGEDQHADSPQPNGDRMVTA